METLKEEVGFVTSSRDYLIFLEGLPSAHIDDTIVSRDDGARALVYSLEGDKVKALMLDRKNPRPGDIFRLDDNGIRVPLGNFLLGRTLSPLGIPIDGKEALPKDGIKLDLNIVAPGVSEREAVSEQLFTGITLVDTILPIGKGQRELIVGEARSGKSGFLLDIIKNQKDTNLVCIYTAIGKPEIDVKRLANEITDSGAGSNTIIIAATSSQSAPLVSIAPDTAFAISEFFARRGRDVLLILDDLGTHAKYLREIALLSQEIPGRESYPGNIFYRHAHLMERAGRFKKDLGGSSITLLPVIETALEELTNLIPTNLMSQTDGHIFFSAALSAQGNYPAIEWDKSVTRVGRQTQSTTQKLVSSQIRRLLTRYKELEVFSKFDTEVSTETRTMIREAQLARELIRQEPGQCLDLKTQAILLSLAFSPYFAEKGAANIVANAPRLIEAIKNSAALKALAGRENTDFGRFLEELNANLTDLEKIET